MNVSTVPFRPRVYVNSFPKSGTNLATLFVRYIVKVHDDHDRQWLSMTDAWTNESRHSAELERGLRLLEPGYFIQGHSRFGDNYAKIFQAHAICKIFVYRDLRDVVVSQAYHIENDDDDKFVHPGKRTAYKEMSHDEIMRAIIRGKECYISIGDRWASFREWLKQDWIYPIRYEDMITYPELVFDDMLTYILSRGLVSNEYIPLLSKKNLEHVKRRTLELVENSTDVHSPTLRIGKPGAWKKEFNDQTKKLFKHYCNGYLIEQGYEIDEEW